jgi:hypothetical protein
MKTFIGLIFLVGFYSCSGNEASENETENEISEQRTNEEIILPAEEESVPIEQEPEEAESFNLAIETFTEFPPEIDGCACYFSKNKEDFNNGIYIYMDDFGNEFGFMNLDGVMTKFDIEHNDSNDSGLEVVELSNTDYTLILNYEQVSELDETFQKEGELKIINSNNEEIIVPFFGECGC